MDDIDYAALADFISQHWEQFLDFMDERDVDELCCEDLVRALEKKAGMS